MKYAINGRNKDIPQTTHRTLFYHCSLAAEIFQQLRHIENCQKFFCCDEVCHKWQKQPLHNLSNK